MPRGRPVAPVELSEEAEAELTRISRSRSLPSSLVQRAQIVLACAAGASNTAVAARLGVGAATVGRWRRRYRERGLEGLHDELRPGRPRTYDDERVATVINDALQTKPTLAAQLPYRNSRPSTRIRLGCGSSSSAARGAPASPHGKSYLTRRRRGEEGGGGGPLTAGAVPSAYRWAWFRWYSRASWKSQYASKSRLARSARSFRTALAPTRRLTDGLA